MQGFLGNLYLVSGWLNSKGLATSPWGFRSSQRSPPVAANHDILRRDLRKAKANLEEERRRKSAALDGPRSAESRGTRRSGNSWKPRYIGKTLSFSLKLRKLWTLCMS